MATSDNPGPDHRRRPLLPWLLAAVFVVTAVAVGIHRYQAKKETEKATDEAATPFVTVITPQTKKADTELVLPGNVEPFADTPIFARTSGYVKRWLTDIGTNVKAGQLLAEIDSPEVDQQLRQAQAAFATALANRQLADVTAQRWKYMLKNKTVSQQETDEKVSQLAAAESDENFASANVRRLEEMKGFEQVVAPFDGRITVRKVDIGDLITAGNAGVETEMFRIAQDNVLRVFTNVAEVNATQIAIGQPAMVELASAPSRPVKGKVAHLAGAIDPASRTLLTEIRVDNSDHHLLAGGYATVHLSTHSDHPALVVPVNTLLFRPEGTMVGTVGSDGAVELKSVEIGRDLGTEVEIKSGIGAKDEIILNPSDSLQNGDHVRVKPSPETAA